MLMGWKASDQEHETRIQGIRKLTKENERLKKMLAEKELEVSMLQEAYKKNEEAAILMNEYRPRGLTVTRMLALLNVPESSY